MQGIADEEKTIAKGSAWLISGIILIKLVSLIYTIIIARYLPQDQIGAFYLVLSIIGTISIFGDLGLNSTASRYLPYFYGKNQLNNAKKFIKAIFIFGGALSFLISILILVFAGTISVFLGQPLVKPVLEAMAFYVFIGEIFNITTNILLGRKLSKENSIAQSIQNLLKLILTLIFIALKLDSWIALVVPFLISFVIALIYSSYLVMKEFSKLKTTVEKEMSYSQMLKEVTPFGMTVTLIGAFSILLNYTDRIMIEFLTPNEQSLTLVAIYTMATSVAIVSGLFNGAICAIFLPTITETYSKNENDFKKINKITNTTMKWGILVTLPITIIFVIFAKEILQIIYGLAYVPGASSFAIFSIGIFLASTTTMQRTVLAGMRMIKIELIMVAFAAITNVILNFFLIPTYGVDGAAIASATSMGLISILGFYYSKKMFEYSLPEDFWKYVASGILSLMVILLLAPAINNVITQPLIKHDGEIIGSISDKIFKLGILGLLILTGIGVYISILHLLKAFGAEEMELLRSAMRKTRIPEPWIEQISEKLNWDANG